MGFVDNSWHVEVEKGLHQITVLNICKLLILSSSKC